MDGNIQTGCKVNVIERLRAAGDNIELQEKDGVSNFLLKDRFCVYQRDKLADPSKTLDDNIDLIRREVVPPVTFIVFHTSTSERLKTTLQSIKNVAFFDKVKIVISYYTRNRQELVDIITELNISNKTTFVSVLDDSAYYLNEAFKVTKNGYLMTVTSGFKVPEDVIIKLDDAINNNFNRVLVIRPVDVNNNLRTIMCAVAKALKIDVLYTIEEKIEKLQEEQQSKTQLIFTWKEINESFNNIYIEK